MALFGSVLRDDFSPESDVDILVSFRPDARRTLFERVDMETEVEGLFGHKIDLVVKKGLRNPFRRRAILRSRQVMYVA